MANFDPDQIQRFLFINSDAIVKKISNDRNIQPVFKDTTALIKTSVKNLSPRDAAEVIMRQHELISGVCAPSADSAKELFRDFQEPDYAIEKGYNIEHNIIFTKKEGNLVNKFMFNIEKVNDEVNGSLLSQVGPPTQQDFKFLFHKINIVNKSKDAFTAKSNFQITLHIAFSFVEDIKENIIVAKSLDGSIQTKTNVLNLIYPFYVTNTPLVGNQEKEVKSGDGIILNQILTMDPTNETFFANTREALGGKKQIHKNYHLTYQKHSINIFKNNNSSVLTDFDSELVIDFIAYEADENPSPIKQDNTPTMNNNLYSLIANLKGKDAVGDFFTGQPDKTVFQQFSQTLSNNQARINLYETAIKCKREGKPLPAGTGLKNDKKTTLDQFSEEARKEISKIRDANQTLREQFNVNLFRYMIDNLDIYTVPIKRRSLVELKDAAVLEAFLGTFGGAIGLTVIGGVLLASFGIVTGGVGFLIAAGVAAAAGGVSAATAENQVFSKGIALLRDGFNVGDITRTAKGQYYSRLDAKRVDAARRKDEDSGAAIEGVPLPLAAANEEDRLRKASAAKADAASTDEAIKLQKQEATKVEEDDLDSFINAEFILFGQLIEVLPIKDSFLLFGGKAVISDAEINSNFLNYYYTPIHMQKVLDFLNENIVKRNNLTYSNEAFIRDITENLLKKSIQLDGALIPLFKELVPTHVNMSVILTDDSNNDTTTFINNIKNESILGPNFAKIKSNLIKAKNLSSTRGTKFRKIYSITSDEDVKYYNFYKGFENWFNNKFSPRPVYNSNAFQEFIIEKHSIPCLTIKAVDTYGTILKDTKNIIFNRKDNANLVTGQTLDNSALLRLPYNFSAPFKSYMFFFVDVGSFMFVSPPDKRNGAIDIEDTFGFSGLYLIKNSSFEYNFQINSNDGGITAGNETSKAEFTGQLITYGDGIAPATGGAPSRSPTIACSGSAPVNAAPAAR